MVIPLLANQDLTPMLLRQCNEEQKIMTTTMTFRKKKKGSKKDVKEK